MADFKKAIERVFSHEGGYTNHKKDPGGATNYGVSLRFLKQLGDYGDIDCDGDVDVDDTKALTPEKACEIYKREFWDRYHYDQIEDDSVATKVFDMVVNIGPATAARVTQNAVNVLREDDPIEVDGLLGEESFNAINKCYPPSDLIFQITQGQKRFYKSLVEKTPALSVFLKGWLRRADQI